VCVVRVLRCVRGGALVVFGGRRPDGLLHQVHLAAGDGRGRDEGAVLGPDQGQVALGGVGALLGRLQLALESPHSSHTLLGHALLQKQTN